MASSGCGGGGGSDGGPTGAGLAFTVAWEQADSAGGANASFDTPIPPSVDAIRFILRPSSGPDCCIAVLRGSPPFLDRRIQLADVQPGPSTLEVHGYPAAFAPNDGVTVTCATRPAGQGSACSGSQRTLPSFGSDEIDVDVLPAVVNRVDVDVYSLPFLLDLEPGDGETADDARPHVSFAVVDAVHDVDLQSVEIDIEKSPVATQAEIEDSEPCSDRVGELPDCSEEGDLDVEGWLVFSRSELPLSPGEADLRITATNTAPIPRDMESNTTFLVPIDEGTTTTTTSSSTTSSTLLPPETFCLSFSVSAPVDLIGLSYAVSYGDTGGDFVGSGEDVSCISTVGGDPQSTLATFNDEDASSTLNAAVISATPFTVPTDVAECVFEQVPPLVLENFDIQVTEATAEDLSSTTATVVVTEIVCPD